MTRSQTVAANTREEDDMRAMYRAGEEEHVVEDQHCHYKIHHIVSIHV